VGLSNAVIRPVVLRVVRHPWFRRMVTSSSPGRAIVARFVAGETLAEALAAARDDLAPRGLSAMLNHLGENVASSREALAAREAYLAEIAAVQDNPSLDVVISVKLTQLGLDLSLDECWSNLVPILDAGSAANLDVMIDMEDHRYVDGTLGLFLRAFERTPRAGIALQSYLRRTPDDLFALPPGCRIRLVKGAYLEPRDVVFTGKREVDRAFRRLFSTALERGHRIDVATHDPAILEGVRQRLDRLGDGWSRVEFQMLYGVRRDLQARFAGQGYPVRVYIPYGTEWYPYLTRRMAERPANLWFFASNLVRTAR
jgi:proline dehydrogenase